MAITAILGVTLAGYLVLRATRPGPAAVIAAVLPGSQAMEVLEQQRQQMIVMEAASHTMHLVGIPEVAAMPDPAGSGGQLPGAGPRHRPVHRVQHDVVVRFRPQHPVQLPE